MGRWGVWIVGAIALCGGVPIESIFDPPDWLDIDQTEPYPNLPYRPHLDTARTPDAPANSATATEVSPPMVPDAVPKEQGPPSPPDGPVPEADPAPAASHPAHDAPVPAPVEAVEATATRPPLGGVSASAQSADDRRETPKQAIVSLTVAPDAPTPAVQGSASQPPPTSGRPDPAPAAEAPLTQPLRATDEAVGPPAPPPAEAKAPDTAPPAPTEPPSAPAATQPSPANASVAPPETGPGLGAVLRDTLSGWFGGGDGPIEVERFVDDHPFDDIADPTVRAATLTGTLVGHRVMGGRVAEFLGIPYAQPPIGPLRFAAPVPVPSNPAREYNASFVRAGCPQRCRLARPMCPRHIDENCLFANVWTPASAKEDSGLPVFVFVHGGSNLSGHGGTYNGSVIAQAGVVVVTFNYRLGALGYLARGNLTGNYGFQDQQALLRWVQANIRAFGGAPARVTLGGQSAGAFSVAAHLVSPASHGLFHRAFLSSPPLGIPMVSHSEHAESIGAIFLNTLDGCDPEAGDEVTCLRAASVDAILTAQKRAAIPVDPLQWVAMPHLASFPMPFANVLSEDVPDQPLALIRAGRWARVPVMLGYTRDEASWFVAHTIPRGVTSWVYELVLKAAFKDAKPVVLAAYPPDTNSTDQRPMFTEMSNDMFWVCPIHNLSLAIPEATFLYRFDHVYRDPGLWGDSDNCCANRSCHGADILPAFLGPSIATFLSSWAVLTPSEVAMSEKFQGHLVSFIASGDPQWPPVGTSARMLVVDEAFAAASAVPQAKCAVWDRVGYV